MGNIFCEEQLNEGGMQREGARAALIAYGDTGQSLIGQGFTRLVRGREHIGIKRKVNLPCFYSSELTRGTIEFVPQGTGARPFSSLSTLR